MVSFEENLIKRINSLMDLMQLYLQNQITTKRLLKPILSNIQSAFLKLMAIVQETQSQDIVKLSMTIADNILAQLKQIIVKLER